MDNSQRIKLLREYAKQVEQGNFDTTDFLDPSIKKGPLTQSRDLAEDALSDQVMLNSKIPVPDKRASRSKIIDFLSRHAEERYPEVKGDISLAEDLVDMDGRKAEALYYPSNGKIQIDSNIAKDDIVKANSAMLHEYRHGRDELYKLPSKISIDDVDRQALAAALKINPDLTPDQQYEILAGGGRGRLAHHGKIKGMPEGTFGRSSLASYLKSGKFKLAGMVGPAATAAGALLAGSASDAMAGAIPGGVEDVGEGSDEQQGPEVTRFSSNPDLARASEKEFRAMQEQGTGEEVQPIDEGEARKQKDIQRKALEMMLSKFRQ